MAVTPIWPEASAVNENGEITFHGRTAESLLGEFGSPLYLIDTDEVRQRAERFVRAAASAFDNTVTAVCGTRAPMLGSARRASSSRFSHRTHGI